MIDKPTENIKVISESTGEIVKTGDNILEQVDVNKLLEYFDLDEYSSDQEQGRVNEIYSYLTKLGLPIDQHETYLRKMELRLGGPNLGETRLGKIWRYIRLDQRLGETIKEMSSYESNNT